MTLSSHTARGSRSDASCTSLADFQTGWPRQSPAGCPSHLAPVPGATSREKTRAHGAGQKGSALACGSRVPLNAPRQVRRDVAKTTAGVRERQGVGAAAHCRYPRHGSHPGFLPWPLHSPPDRIWSTEASHAWQRTTPASIRASPVVPGVEQAHQGPFAVCSRRPCPASGWEDTGVPTHRDTEGPESSRASGGPCLGLGRAIKAEAWQRGL